MSLMRTRMFLNANSVAIIFPMCTNAALLVLYANWSRGSMLARCSDQRRTYVILGELHETRDRADVDDHTGIACLNTVVRALVE